MLAFLDPGAAGFAPAANATQGAIVEVPDPGAQAPASLSGAVTYSSASPMTVVVTAFSTAAPPPPAGNGEPAGTIVIPPAFQGQAGGNWVAPFEIPRLAAGDYLVAAFADADGDFSPYYRIRANPTAGDIAGGVLSGPCASPLPLKPVTAPNPIPLLATLCGPIPSERPQFGVSGSSELSRAAVPAGGTVDLALDGKAFKNAVVLYPKSWGCHQYLQDQGVPEADRKPLGMDLIAKYKKWVCTEKRMKLGKKNAVYMHPLPADRGAEVEDAVIDGPQSIVFDQAALRLLVEYAGENRVMLGSDMPFPIGDPEPRKVIEDGGCFDDAQRKAMLSQTARAVFRLRPDTRPKGQEEAS